MYRCDDCGSMFSEPDAKKVWMEDYYGVASMFPNRTYESIECCPYCGSEEFESYCEEEE